MRPIGSGDSVSIRSATGDPYSRYMSQMGKGDGSRSGAQGGNAPQIDRKQVRELYRWLRRNPGALAQVAQMLGEMEAT